MKEGAFEWSRTCSVMWAVSMSCEKSRVEMAMVLAREGSGYHRYSTRRGFGRAWAMAWRLGRF